MTIYKIITMVKLIQVVQRVWYVKLILIFIFEESKLLKKWPNIYKKKQKKYRNQKKNIKFIIKKYLNLKKIMACSFGAVIFVPKKNWILGAVFSLYSSLLEVCLLSRIKHGIIIYATLLHCLTN